MDPKHLPAAVLVALGLTQEGLAQAEDPPERVVYEVGFESCLSAARYDEPYEPRSEPLPDPLGPMLPLTGPGLSTTNSDGRLSGVSHMDFFYPGDFEQRVHVREIAAEGAWMSEEEPRAPLYAPTGRYPQGPVMSQLYEVGEEEEAGSRRRCGVGRRQRAMQARYLPDDAPRRRLLAALVAEARLPRDVLDALDEELVSLCPGRGWR